MGYKFYEICNWKKKNFRERIKVTTLYRSWTIRTYKKQAELLVKEVNSSNFENILIQLQVLDLKCQAILNYIGIPQNGYKTDEDFLQHLTEEALGTLKDKYINDEQDACFTSFIKEVLIRELQDIKNE